LTVIDEDTPQPAKNGYVHRVQFGDEEHLDSIGLLSRLRSSECRGKGNGRRNNLGWDNGTCRNISLTTARLLAPQIPFSLLSQIDKKSHQSVVPDHTSDLNKTPCRISIPGSTVTEVEDLHSPSKNGTSRALRPPCLPPGSRFEHHLITFLQKGSIPRKSSTNPLLFTRSEI
jgi:hypothetical protein